MPPRPTRSGVPKGTRGRIIDLLRRSALTANELALRLGLTHNAVRGHLAALQHEGFIREAGSRRGKTRPSVVYELVPDAEAGLSSAYIPFVAQLVRVLQEQLRPAKLEEVMRAAGRGLARNWPKMHGSLAKRVEGASTLLEELGAPNEIERLDGGFVIRNHSTCMLSQAVHGRPEVCRAVESLLDELLEVSVRECCERSEARPRCCFEIALDGGASSGRVARKGREVRS
jgi:predicted ArsR family transcriptional regulator